MTEQRSDSSGWIPAVRPRILVVDDAEDARAMYGGYLEHRGFEVRMASDGAEAVRVALVSRPRVIVMDLGMPKLDGWTAMHLLRSDPRTRDALIVVVSARVSREDRVRAAANGANYFLTKPCLPMTLLETIRLALKAA